MSVTLASSPPEPVRVRIREIPVVSTDGMGKDRHYYHVSINEGPMCTVMMSNGIAYCADHDHHCQCERAVLTRFPKVTK